MAKVQPPDSRFTVVGLAGAVAELGDEEPDPDPDPEPAAEPTLGGLALESKAPPDFRRPLRTVYLVTPQLISLDR